MDGGDDWQVLGLAGTGSKSLKLHDVFDAFVVLGAGDGAMYDVGHVTVTAGTWTLAIANKTAGWSFSIALASPTPAPAQSSAEWIVEDPAANERAAVVDGHDDRTAAMGHAKLGAERQGPVSRGHGFLVETLTRGRLAARLIAVERGHARETPAAA